MAQENKPPEWENAEFIDIREAAKWAWSAVFLFA